ncbi:MAG: V/A-type H+/Na+-transporting ATPase subunit [Thermoplasmata archaeon]|jgi:V/A-type H+-transporting ATPase subunit C|nr:V/A-type H+/Na+-transporting ATPase subunit [Thermoplasmata archaeon]
MGLLSRKGFTNYPYAVARVQAKRAKLIPRSEYAKILKMDVAEITRFIQDSAYKSEVDELASKFVGLDLLEAALTVNEERTYEQVRQMLSGEGGALINLFLDRYHFEDVKTLLRGKNAGATRDELLREMVLENEHAYGLFAPALSDDVKGIPDVVAAFEKGPHASREWAAILAKVPAGSPLPRYEDALDKAYYSRLVAALEQSTEKGSKEMQEFVRREIDTRNLLNAARWVAAGEAGDFSPYVVPGGRSLKVADVMGLARAKDLAAMAEMLADSRAYATVREELAKAGETRRLGPFQAAVWRAHLAQLDLLAHGNPLSIIPILLFLVRKHREVTTLRAVARGKAAGLSEERLQELVV